MQIKNNKRYSGSSAWTVSVRNFVICSSDSLASILSLEFDTFLGCGQECAEAVKADFGSIDILVHSLANGPEVRILFMEI